MLGLGGRRGVIDGRTGTWGEGEELLGVGGRK